MSASHQVADAANEKNHENRALEAVAERNRYEASHKMRGIRVNPRLTILVKAEKATPEHIKFLKEKYANT